MNLRQLEYFVTIAEEGSLTRAAERLLVAQPSLSQQLRALEGEVGGPLVERLPRGVQLTAAGEQFLPEARSAIRHAERALGSARTTLGLEAGRLELAATSSVAAGILPAVLPEWQRRHPEVEVSLVEYPHRRTLDEAVRDGAGDMAVGSPPAAWQGSAEQLGWEQFVIVLPREDPLLAERSVAFDDLRDRRWVHFTAEHGLAQLLDERCGDAGFRPRVAVRTSQVAAAPHFAAGGLGPALVPDHVVSANLEYLCRPASPPLARPVVAFARSDWSPVALAFLEVLREHPWGRKPRGAVDLS